MQKLRIALGRLFNDSRGEQTPPPLTFLSDRINSEGLEISPYRPLDARHSEFRLLRILPSTSDGNLRFDLQHHSLNGPPEYHALSYAWGSDRVVKPIRLNNGVLLIRESLWNFLYELGKLLGTGAYFWCDAICINQQLVSERNSQVAMMGDIFSTAKSVYSWLGEADQFTSSMFCEINSGSWNMFYIPHISIYPYWNRLWVMQEIALATEVKILCGSFVARWDDVYDAIMSMKIEYYPEETIKFRLKISTLRSIQLEHARNWDTSGRFRVAPSSRNAWQLFMVFQHAKCQDLHDWLYALSALMNDDDRKFLTVDYSSSPLHVFAQIMSFNRSSDLNSVGQIENLCRKFDLRAYPEEIRRTVTTEFPFAVHIAGHIGRGNLDKKAPVLLDVTEQFKKFKSGWPKVYHVREVELSPGLIVASTSLLEGDVYLQFSDYWGTYLIARPMENRLMIVGRLVTPFYIPRRLSKAEFLAVGSYLAHCLPDAVFNPQPESYEPFLNAVKRCGENGRWKNAEVEIIIRINCAALIELTCRFLYL